MAEVRVGRDAVVHAFGPELEAVCEVEPGTVVTFETRDCFDNQIRGETDLVTEVDFSRLNLATGPVAVRGAEPGDSVVAEILAVRPAPVGVATLIPGFGPLAHLVDAPRTQMFEVGEREIAMGRIRFPTQPMVGVIGVAPESEEIPTRFAGRHGGNLDDHWHGAGARIFMPVRRPGGMFAVGDMHASMGDGEVCFTGVEVAGEVDVRLRLLKGKQARWPVTELAGSWLPHATAVEYEDALREVSEEAARLLVDEWGFSMEEAFVFLSVACDVGITQGCRPAPGYGMIARFRIPRVSACPAPFRQ
jgi:amidase